VVGIYVSAVASCPRLVDQRRHIACPHSSTEATADDPEKNVCRDVCQKRVAKAIEGYSYPTKTGLKAVSGLGGDFAYLRTRRIAPAKLLEIEHAQVWTALQLAHCETLSPYIEAPFLWAGDELEAVCYLPRFRREDAPALRRKLKEADSVALYSWQPTSMNCVLMCRAGLRRTSFRWIMK
jgi:adenine-specific DNA-methyltransferase